MLIIFQQIYLTLGGTLTGTTTPSKCGYVSSGNEGVTSHLSELQKWSLTNGCSLEL